MEVGDLKYVIQWGNKLTNRVKQAGINTITEDNVEEVKNLYQIGKKRTKYLKMFMKREGVDEVVERNEDFLVRQRDENLYDIFFSDISSDKAVLELARIKVTGTQTASERTRTKGQLLFRRKKDDKLFKLRFKSTDKSIKPIGGNILTIEIQRVIWKTIEVAFSRSGESIETIPKSL